MPGNEINEKTIMGYKLKFTTSYDESDANGEFVILNISISDELKALIKGSTINAISEVTISRGPDDTHAPKIKRYKIKSVINNQLSSGSRDIIFAKELVDSGNISLKYKSVDLVIHTIDSLKSNFRTLIETIVGCLNISQEVTFNVTGELR